MQIIEITVAADGGQGDGSLLRRATLAREVYATIEHGTESLEADNLGADLAYLLGAILRGDSGCAWDHDRPLVRLLRQHFADGHAVWRYAHVDEADGQDEDSRLDRARTTLGDVLDSPAFERLEERVQAEVRSTLRCL